MTSLWTCNIFDPVRLQYSLFMANQTEDDYSRGRLLLTGSRALNIFLLCHLIKNEKKKFRSNKPEHELSK